MRRSGCTSRSSFGVLARRPAVARATQQRGFRRGFTLVEMLIVIAILLALGGIVVINLMGTKDRADADIQRAQFSQIDAAMKMFKLHMNRYPTQDEGLIALVSKEAITDEQEALKWQGPYLDEAVTKDKWSHDLIYRYPGELRGEQYYDLVSLGPDGQENTADDITNHDRHKGADGAVARDENGAGAGAATTSAAPPTR